MRPYLEAAERQGRFGVIAIVGCQEFQWVLSGANRAGLGKAVSFDFFKEERRVGIYYFYMPDPEFGPGFIKLGTYAPYSVKVWLNGHEWAKRQAARAGITFIALSKGSRLAGSLNGCRQSATPSVPITSRRSSIAGCQRSRLR